MDILLIVLDTARGDIVNSMVSNGELPNLSELATEGHFYTNAQSNGPWTVPSHAALFTGKYPNETGVSGNDPSYDAVPLIEDLKKRGFKAGGFSSNPWLSSEFNFDNSFDYFRNQFNYYPEATSVEDILSASDNLRNIVLNVLSGSPISSARKTLVNLIFSAYRYRFRDDSGASWLFKKTADWLRNDDQQFAFINVTEAHLAYELPDNWLPEGISQQKLKETQQDPVLHNAGVSTMSEDDLKLLQRVYRATLRYLDAEIGKLCNQISNDTIVIVTSDHGEHFGEYGRFGHQYSLYKELLHVPLIIHAPWTESEEIKSIVELRSLYQYILDIAEGDRKILPERDYYIAETISPTPSLKSLESKSGNVREYAKRYGNGARCISDGKRKLIEFADGSTEIIENNVPKDDSEEIKQSLQSKLVSECGEVSYGNRQEIEYSGEIKSRLDHLGYV